MLPAMDIKASCRRLALLLLLPLAGACSGTSTDPLASDGELAPLPHEQQLESLGYTLGTDAGPQHQQQPHNQVGHETMPPPGAGSGGSDDRPPPRPQRPFSALPSDPGRPVDEYEFVFAEDGTATLERIASGGPEGLPYEASCEYSLFIRHHAFPDYRFMLFAPENMWVTDYVGRTTEFIYPTGSTDPVLEVDGTTVSYHQSFRGKFDDGSGDEVGIDFSLKASPRDGGVDYVLTAANTGKVALKWVQAVFCLHAVAPQMPAEAFHEDSGATNWVYDGSEWQTFPSDRPGQPGSFRSYLFRPEYGFVARQLPTEEWTMAIGWDEALILESVGPHCIHSNPAITDLAPGKTLERRGRVGLVRGDKESVRKAYCADFECP